MSGYRDNYELHMKIMKIHMKIMNIKPGFFYLHRLQTSFIQSMETFQNYRYYHIGIQYKS